MASSSKNGKIDKATSLSNIKSRLEAFKDYYDEAYRTSAKNYDSDVFELRKILDNIKQNPKYQDQCKKLYESQFTKYKTIDEIVNEVYAVNSS
jgi:hypothetical protein